MRHTKSILASKPLRFGMVLAVLLTLYSIISPKTFAGLNSKSLKIALPLNGFLSNGFTTVNRVQQIVNLIKLNYQSLKFNNAVEKNAAQDEFKWIFTAEGISFFPPVVDKNGTIYAATTDINLELNLQDLINKGPEDALVDIKTNIYSLQPLPLKPTGKEDWVFSGIDGIIIFPPVVSTDGTILVESIEGVNNDSINLMGKLTAIDQNGKNKWGTTVNFDNQIFIAPPVIGSDGGILVASVNIFDFTNINNIEDLITHISSIDPANGGIKWSFDAAAFSDDHLIVLAPPIIAQSGDTVFISAINAKNLSIQEEINLFIEEFETNAQIDEEKKEALLEAVKNGKDFTSILDEIEGETELLLNDELDKFLDDILNQLCNLIALDANNGGLKWQSPLPGICFVPPIIDTVNGEKIFVSAVNFSLQVDLEASVDIQIVNPKDPASDLEVKIDIIPPEKDDIILTPFGTLSSVDVSNGGIIWSTNIDDIILLDPVIDQGNERIIVSGTDGSDIRFDLNDFSINIFDSKNKIHALNKNNGAVEWVSEAFNGLIASSIVSNVNFPLLLGTDGSVFFTLFDEIETANGEERTPSQMIHAVNPDGSTKWEDPFAPEGFLTSAPVISRLDNAIFLSASSLRNSLEIPPFLKGGGQLQGLIPDLKGRLVRLNSGNGTISRSVEIDGFPPSSPVIDTGLNAIYIITSDFEIGVRPFSFDLLSFVYAAELNQN